MSKCKTDSFILELPLLCNERHINALNKRFEVAREIYNLCLGEIKKRINNMRNCVEYKEAVAEKKSKERTQKLSEIKTFFGIEEYDMHSFVVPIKNHYNLLDINTCQKLATRAYQAGKKYMYGDAKRLNFKKFGTMDSVEGKDNECGIRFDKKRMLLKWMNLSIRVKIKKNDIFAQEALQNRIKYSRIYKKFIRGEERYFLQIVLEGTPPPKRNRDGSFKTIIGDENDIVSYDLGPSSIAITSKNNVELSELAHGIELHEKEKIKLQRRLDRSRRKTNSDNYNKDGTVKKGRKTWIRSKNYMKLLMKLKDINRKITNERKISHNKLANKIISLGLDVRTEDMEFKKLQKRLKKTEVSEKTGKFKRKSRFGKSLGIHSPGAFTAIIRRKLKYYKKELIEIETKQIKASQFNHSTENYEKKKLHQRWTDIDGNKIQRDLYSSFLMYNVDITYNTTQEIDKKTNEIKEVTKVIYTINMEKCNQFFQNFKELHNKEMVRLKELIKNGTKLPLCMGIKKIDQYF